MIFQEPMTALNPLYTVGNQIAEVLEAARRARQEPRARPRRSSCSHAPAFPIRSSSVDAFPHQLSGGQRQRAMIAMALACRPKLLIADEPTTALDVTIQAQILALLDDLQREYGMAILFITHDLNLVRRFTHRVGVMEKGRLVEQGPTADVFAHPQHPYTIKLINSRPQRAGAAGAADAPILAAAADVNVDFVVGQGLVRQGGVPRGARRDARAASAAKRSASSASRDRARRRSGMALLALQPIAAGKVTLEGMRLDDADRATLRAMRRRMQVVFQDPFGVAVSRG